MRGSGRRLHAASTRSAERSIASTISPPSRSPVEEQRRAEIARKAAEEIARERRQKAEEERERRQREEREAAHQRWLQDDLLRMSSDWRQADIVKAYLAAVEARVPEAEWTPDFAAWFSWATRQRRRLGGPVLPELLPGEAERLRD